MRTLTPKQHDALGRPDLQTAKVVGWHPGGGPIIRVDDGSYRWVHWSGRLKPVARPVLEEIGL